MKEIFTILCSNYLMQDNFNPFPIPEMLSILLLKAAYSSTIDPSPLSLAEQLQSFLIKVQICVIVFFFLVFFPWTIITYQIVYPLAINGYWHLLFLTAFNFTQGGLENPTTKIMETTRCMPMKFLPDVNVNGRHKIIFLTWLVSSVNYDQQVPKRHKQPVFWKCNFWTQ